VHMSLEVKQYLVKAKALLAPMGAGDLEYFRAAASAISEWGGSVTKRTTQTFSRRGPLRAYVYAYIYIYLYIYIYIYIYTYIFIYIYLFI